jgi:hypothetical protein
MSDSSFEIGWVSQRLHGVLGKPSFVTSERCRWTLRQLGPCSLSINVLLDDITRTPAVWVFDPIHPSRKMEHILIQDEQSLDHAICAIMQHLANANIGAHASCSPIPASSQEFLEQLLADSLMPKVGNELKQLITLVQMALASITTSDAPD